MISTDAKSSRSWHTVMPFLLLAIAGFLVYFNALHGAFIWDDEVLVKNNLAIRDWSKLPDLFTQDWGGGHSYGFYRPLTMLSYAVDYASGKLDSRSYHLSNIFLHVLTSFSIYFLIHLLFKNRLLALCAGLLFVVHPIHTEAVAYISGRADSLAALFIILSFIFYIRYLESGSKRLFWFILIWYAFALLSKENSLIFPVLLLLYHYAFKKSFKIKELLPIVGLVFVYLFLRFAVLKLPVSRAYITTQWQYSLRQVPGFFVAIVAYIRLLFFPVNLHMDYGDMLFRPADLRVIAGVAVSLSLLIYAFRKRNSNVLFFFSVCWFFIALLPSSSIYPVTAFYMAEHWLYLPSIGFFIIVSKGLADLYTCKKARIFELFFAIIIVAYSCLTIMQNIYWRDPVSFYTRTLKFAPSSARVYNNLGYVYADSGKYPEAMAMYKKAIAINPNYADAYNNLGVACMNLNKNEEAIAAYKKAIEINPGSANPYDNLGIVLSQSGKSAEALASFKQAIEIDPHFGDAYFNAALEYLFQKQYTLAIQYCDKARVLGYQVPRRLLKILEPYRK